MRCLSGSNRLSRLPSVYDQWEDVITLESNPWKPWRCALCKDWGSHSHHPLIWSVPPEISFDLKASFDDEGIKLQVHWNALEMLHFPSAIWPRFFGDICVTPCTFARSCEAMCWEHGLLAIRGMV